ncbi:MAG: hypothetical protein H6696_00930 [Deferribacteres bacterium]|nr:hypothetical protein [candidate division KSB1 bacterium]MCB9500471.1 hypothetical protein [Deferribacteres bacterium]
MKDGDVKRAELLMDHYKDTSQLIQTHWAIRNRLFLFVLILLSFMALELTNPGSIAAIVNEYLKKYLGDQSKMTLSFDLISSVLWFLLLSLVIQYYQRSINVDRRFRYMQNIEEQLCEILGENTITREGLSYKTLNGRPDAPKTRPWFLRMVGPIYTYIFPVLLSVFICYKIYKENIALSESKLQHDVSDGFNIFIGVILFVFNVLYVYWNLCEKSKERSST